MLMFPLSQERKSTFFAYFLNGGGGVRGAGVWRLQMDQIDQMDQMDNVGAPVFALMGYAVASHVIPRGLLCRSVVWLRQVICRRAEQTAAAMQNLSAKIHRRGMQNRGCDQREQPHPAFFEKGWGVRGEGENFFSHGKKFSPSPRFPPPLTKKKTADDRRRFGRGGARKRRRYS